MLSFTNHVRIYLCTAPTDMRRSFDGLSSVVTAVLNRDPLSGHLFLFLNRRRDRVKLLYWDHDGLAIWMKRLEAGTFETPPGAAGQACLELDATQWTLLLGGVSLASVQRRKRYALPR